MMANYFLLTAQITIVLFDELASTSAKIKM